MKNIERLNQSNMQKLIDNTIGGIIRYGGSEKMSCEVKERVGLREARANISDLFSSVVNSYADILIGNAKKGGKTATLISTEILYSLLECHKFNAKLQFDEETNQYEVTIDEIEAYGVGDTKEEALEILLDNIEMLCEEFFENLELYLRIESKKKLYPYYLRIKYCSDKKELLSMLLQD